LRNILTRQYGREITRRNIMNKNKLTEHELTKRLDNEFTDVDFRLTECPTKGVVANVYFYEDKLKEEYNE